MDIVERFGVEFVTYKFQGNAKMWWRSYVECQPAQTPPAFSAPAPQVPEVQHAAFVAPRMDASLEIGTFPRLTTGPIMMSNQHELFTKFLKLKPPVSKGAESEDAYDFLVDCHELLHKMCIVERYGVEFVTYQFQGNAKMWWRSHVECQPTEAPL